MHGNVPQTADRLNRVPVLEAKNARVQDKNMNITVEHKLEESTTLLGLHMAAISLDWHIRLVRLQSDNFRFFLGKHTDKRQTSVCPMSNR